MRQRKKTDQSARGRFFALFLCTCAGTIALCLAALNLFLEPYYRYMKQQALHDICAMLNEAAREDTIYTETFAARLKETTDRDNIQIIILDEDSLTVYATVADAEFLGRRLWEKLIETDAAMLAEGSGSGHYRTETGQDPSGAGYLEAFGFLENGNVFLMRTPLSGIQDSVRIANRFMLIVGICALAVGALVSWFSSYWAGIFELESENRRLEADLENSRKLEAERRSFLSDVTHELKTPIALIQGYAEGLKDGVCENAEDRAEYLTVILDESGRMDRMVTTLTSLNQLESGAEPYTPEIFDLAAMIQNFLKSADILMNGQNAAVRYAGEETFSVFADEFRTEDVLRNYFTNALRHLDGERVIEVRLTRTETGRARVSVFNTGKPVPEESLPHLFEKFYKADRARARAYGGSGIGLAIVKAIQEQAGEAYGVENFDNGVLFWFEVCPADRAGEAGTLPGAPVPDSGNEGEAS